MCIVLKCKYLCHLCAVLAECQRFRLVFTALCMNIVISQVILIFSYSSRVYLLFKTHFYLDSLSECDELVYLWSSLFL